MHKSDEIKEVVKALIITQKSIEKIVKNKIAKGTKFDFAYADLSAVLEVVKPPLNENNIALVQAVNHNGESDAIAVIETQLFHESGQWIGSETPVYCASKDNPQAIGSAISYMKRYSILALLGLATEDDDGKTGKKKPLGISKPNKKEQTVLTTIYNKLTPPDGMEVDRTKVNEILYANKGNYPDDPKTVGAIVAWFEAHDAKEIFKSNKPKPLKWTCKECSHEFDAHKEGLCPKCASPDIIEQKG